MADKKITDMTALTTPASADVLPIVDVSEAAAADKNKKITVSELFKGVPDGTAAAPAIAFESDDDNGIFLSDTDTVGIATNGTGRLFVDANGRVGIGVAAPNTSLEIASNANGQTDTTIPKIRLTNTDEFAVSTDIVGSYEFYSKDLSDPDIITGFIQNVATSAGVSYDLTFGTKATGIGVDAQEKLRITSDGTFQHKGAGTTGSPGSPAVGFNGSAPSNSLVIDSSGRLGLGTSSPDSLLVLNAAAPTLKIKGLQGDPLTNPHGYIDFENTNAQTYVAARIIARGQTDAARNGQLLIQTNSDGVSDPTANLATAVTIDQAGNVGIGTTSPSGVFEVIDGDNELRFASGYAELRIRSATGGLSRVVFGDQDDGARGSIQYDSSDDSLQLRGYNNSERARIDSSGRLLVGTSSSSTTDTLVLTGHSSSATANPIIRLRRGSLPTDGNSVGTFTFEGSDNGVGAQISAFADGSNWATNDYPTRLEFSTTADGASSPTERMRIDSSGNVGINTTNPSNAFLTGTIVNTSGGSKSGYRAYGGGTAVMHLYQQDDLTILGSGENANAKLAFNTGDGLGTERMRIDSSGRLLVGTSTSLNNFVQGGLQLQGTGADAYITCTRFSSSATDPSGIILGRSRSATKGTNTIVEDDDRLGDIWFTGADGTGYIPAARIRAEVDGTPGTDDMPGRLVFSTTANGESSPTERMRIDSDGNVYFGTNAVTGGVYGSLAIAKYYSAATSTAGIASLESYGGSSSTRYHFIFSNPNGIVGSISTSSSATAYNTSSDYRLKENVVPLTGAADRLKLIPVHRFNFIADPDTTVDGFIAHEAQAVVPECVTGEKDAVDADGNPEYQGIDQSKLVPLLTAALQEALAKIETLEAKVAALEAG